jgi:hypothetical protein
MSANGNLLPPLSFGQLVGKTILTDICVTSVAAATQIVEATPQFRIDGKTLIFSLFYNGQKAN